MTVTLYSWTPPTTHTSKYLLRPTVLNGPRIAPLNPSEAWDDFADGVVRSNEAGYQANRQRVADQVLEDIDDWYSPQIEEDGFLEQLDRSAEIVRFP